jgi:hypothetical protein
MNVVVRLLWFHCTIDPWMNPLPVMVRLSPDVPAVTLF